MNETFPTWHFYDATGASIHRSYSGPAEHLAANTPEGCEARTDAPARGEPPPMISPAMLIKARIAALESQQPRALREALLALLPEGHSARAKLQAIEDEIATHRVELSRAIDMPANSGGTDPSGS